MSINGLVLLTWTNSLNSPGRFLPNLKALKQKLNRVLETKGQVPELHGQT